MQNLNIRMSNWKDRRLTFRPKKTKVCVKVHESKCLVDLTLLSVLTASSLKRTCKHLVFVWTSIRLMKLIKLHLILRHQPEKEKSILYSITTTDQHLVVNLQKPPSIYLT